jgi:hypothetical protein
MLLVHLGNVEVSDILELVQIVFIGGILEELRLGLTVNVNDGLILKVIRLVDE